MGTTVEVLLIGKDKAVILRAEKATSKTAKPTYVTSFGGAVRPDEEPQDAALRIITEATNLHLEKGRLQPYRTYHKGLDRGATDGDVYYFVAAIIDTGSLRLPDDHVSIIVSDEAMLQQLAMPPLLRQLLADYFAGFRSFLFFPDIDPPTKKKLLDSHYAQITHAKKPSSFSQPIAIACTGLVASGKSSIASPLAGHIGAVTISSDRVRETFFRLGYNFSQIYSFDTALIERAAKHRYNLFLDFNVSTGMTILDSLHTLGYRIVVIYANPPYSFIKEKILSGEARRRATRKGQVMSFFPKNEFLYESMLRWKNDHQTMLPVLKKKYGIWFEADTSKKDPQEIGQQIIAQFDRDILE